MIDRPYDHTLHGLKSAHDIPDEWTGLVRLTFDQSPDSWVWVLEGFAHKEMGYAYTSGSTGRSYYYLKGQHYLPNAYWKVMFDMYKGTELEAECLANMLGAP